MVKKMTMKVKFNHHKNYLKIDLLQEESDVLRECSIITDFSYIAVISIALKADLH